LTISLVVALGGLALGWLVYKDFKAGQPDPLQKPLGPVYTLLQNKWYFDEFYNYFVVKPVIWISEVFTYRWMDKGAIDGILHFIGKLPIWIGDFLRNKFDTPFINVFIGDGTAAVFQKAGHELRYTQTGRIQTYLIASASFLIVLVAVLAYLFLA
jgi:NADH-quinone oxidoreductase subunit L